MKQSRTFPPVNVVADLAIILAYKEDTRRLEEALRTEGFEVEVQRAVYTESELNYSRTIRCLLNHRHAWQRAASRDRCTLVVESDFVPCRNFGITSAPFSPQSHGAMAWGFLYCGGPRIFWAHPDGSLEGHAACPVATLVSPAVAPLLVRFADEELLRSPKEAHSLWDTAFQWWVMGWGARCFLPYQHYGEHGGIVNPEHAHAQVGWVRHFPLLQKFAAFNNHHAECLIAPLRFLPPYADGSRLKFIFTRFIARLIGFARLARGHVVTPAQGQSSRDRRRAHVSAFTRLL